MSVFIKRRQDALPSLERPDAGSGPGPVDGGGDGDGDGGSSGGGGGGGGGTSPPPTTGSPHPFLSDVGLVYAKGGFWFDSEQDFRDKTDLLSTGAGLWQPQRYNFTPTVGEHIRRQGLDQEIIDGSGQLFTGNGAKQCVVRFDFYCEPQYQDKVNAKMPYGMWGGADISFNGFDSVAKCRWFNNFTNLVNGWHFTSNFIRSFNRWSLSLYDAYRYERRPSAYRPNQNRLYSDNLAGDVDAISLGVWQTIDLDLKMNTGTNANGYLRMYVDGVLRSSRTNIMWAPNPENRSFDGYGMGVQGVNWRCKVGADGDDPPMTRTNTCRYRNFRVYADMYPGSTILSDFRKPPVPLR